MKKTIAILAVILAFACFLAIASCSETPITNPTDPNDPTDPNTPSVPIAVTAVSIEQDDGTEVAVKGTRTFTAIVLPSNATNKGVVWSIGKETYATINPSTGVVTGKKTGKATITVTTLDGGKTDEIDIQVVETIDITGVTIADKDNAKSIRINETKQLSAVVAPEGVVQTITWSSSASNIASVSSAGILTGVSKGTAVITAASAVDDTKKDTVTVVVPDAQPVTAILLRHPDTWDQSPDLRGTPLHMFSGETKTLSYLIVPEGSLGNVEAKSTNTAVASVYPENGYFKIGAGNTEGLSIITLTSVSNPSIVAYLEVQVKKTVTLKRTATNAIIIDGNNETTIDSTKGSMDIKELMVNKTMTIDASAAWTSSDNLADGQKLDVTWSSNDNAVDFVIDQTNPMKVTLKAIKGTKQGIYPEKNATITVKPFLNPSLTWSVEVRVKEPIVRLELNAGTATITPVDGITDPLALQFSLAINKKTEIKVTAVPTNSSATIESIEWEKLGYDNIADFKGGTLTKDVFEVTIKSIDDAAVGKKDHFKVKIKTVDDKGDEKNAEATLILSIK